MRVKEKIEVSGYFWLPSFPKKRIPGVLRISDGGRIELEILGSFYENTEVLDIISLNKETKVERIIGEIEKYGDVTLDDCLFINISTSDTSMSLIYARKAFLGIAYDDKEPILFNTFKFSVEGINEWVNLNRINPKFKENGDISIEYSPPKEVSIELYNGMKLLISSSWSLSELPITTEAKITKKTYLQLISDHALSTDEFTSIAYKLTNFLCFVIDNTVCIDHISVTSNETQLVPVLLYYRTQPYTENEPEIEWHRMLFRYRQIKENAERIINSWLNAYDKIEPSLNLYFSVSTGDQKYVESKFLALAQGLETYHRRTSNKNRMDEDEFEKLTETLIDKCPKKHQDWLSGRLKYGNEYSLRQRLKRIVEPFKEFIGNRKDRDRLIVDILNTRNYLTHYSESLKEESVSGEELWFLYRKMEALFQLIFLYKVLDFTKEEVKAIIADNEQLRLKLGLTTENIESIK